VLALYAYIAYNKCMQYTIRKVPEGLDRALRRRARELGQSLNEVAIAALARGAGLNESGGRQRDLSDIAGTWRSDRAFDSAVAAQDAVDQELWK
jgi:antitoxin FitA-like protein